MKKYWYCIALIGFFGCSVKKKLVKKNQIFLDFQEIIAKHSDIPDAPFQAQLQTISSDIQNQNHLELIYTTSMPRVDLINFYIQHMERSGWNRIVYFDTTDYCMVFHKPGKTCLIVIQDTKYFVYIAKK